MFFSLPLIVFTLHLVALELPSFRFEEHVKDYGYLRRFWETDAALVLGLAGLNSWDKRLNGGVKKPNG